MNWFIIAAAISVAAGIFSLIKSLTNNRKEGTENQTTTPQLEQKIKSKASYGKMWNWIIPIGIISALVLGIWIAPKYFNEKISRVSTNAIFIWTLDPSQHGAKRTSGPLQAEVVIDDGKIFNFVMYYYRKGKKEEAIFEGERTSTRKIEGFWWQNNPEDRGQWYLKPDPANDRLFVGEHSDLSQEWTPIKLILKLK